VRNGTTVRLRLGLGAALCLATAGLRAESAEFLLFAAGISSFQPGEPQPLSLGFGSLGAGVSSAGEGGAPEADQFRLDLSASFRAAFSEPAATAQVSPPTAPGKRPLLRGRTLGLTLGVLAAVPVVGELVWWKGNEKGSFHFHDEGWFGRDSYAGGADKASHFFFGYMAGRELSMWYEKFGNAPKQSRALAVGLTTLGGALIELGDGLTEVYGYSWTDVTCNFAGALAAVGIEAAGVDDLVGLRFGVVSAEIPPPPNRAYGWGHDYSEDIYSIDFKLAGALRRMRLRPGAARFFLVSLTYGSKGYRFSPVDVRERNIGVDVGLSVPEILLAIGVPKTTWWGQVLLTLFEYFRLPYTAFGFQYDLNHGRWQGPSTGDRFDPGKVIYP
jgi:Predicted periplasmic lipoprotein (DUF2279)